MSSSLVVTDLAFAWPDGDPLFDGLDLAARTRSHRPRRRQRLGQIDPVAPDRRCAGARARLDPGRGRPRLPAAGPHTRRPAAGRRAARHRRRRAALHAIEAGDSDPAHFEAIGDDWDVEDRARASLDRLGLRHIGLDRRVGEVSGGEAVLLGLAAQFVRRPDVLLLDEPTNNLDLTARHRLYDALLTWPGVLLVVSHDRELLDLVDQMAELRDGAVRLVRRQHRRLRGDARRRAGGGGAHGAHRRVRCTPAAARTGRRADQVGPSGSLRPEDVGQQARTEDRHGRPQAPGPGVGRQAPHHARREARRGAGTP